MVRNDWAILVDLIYTIYLKYPNNRELLSVIKYINNVDREIPLFLIVTGTNILAL